jgi:hypothetical protein
MFDGVYLLVSDDKYKIGQAVDIAQRAKQLSKIWGIDLLNSYFIRTSDFDSLERGLHKLLAQYRLTNLPQQDGHTEWFDISSIDKCFKLIEVLGHEIQKGIKLPKMTTKQIISKTMQAKLERKLLADEKKRLKLEEINKHNHQVELKFIQFLKDNPPNKIITNDQINYELVYFAEHKLAEQAMQTNGDFYTGIISGFYFKHLGGGSRLVNSLSSYANSCVKMDVIDWRHQDKDYGEEVSKYLRTSYANYTKNKKGRSGVLQNTTFNI